MVPIQLLLVVVGAIVVTALARWRGLQPSLVVVVIASAASFVPGMPRFELDADLILGVVLPPLLYSAALNFSFHSFTKNLRNILSLGVGMVVVSTVVTGVVADWVVPALAFVPALVLGAVVAPPDAVAALSVGRELGLPRRLMAILTGESLVNDAAALTIFSLTVAAVTGGHTIVDNPLLLFAYAAVVGVLVGVVVGHVVNWTRKRLRDSGLETALGLVVPFAAYLLAEELEASGVLAVVAAGFVLGHNDASAGFSTRLQGREVWKSLDVLLEAFVFAYMGLQCKFVFADLDVSGWSFAGGAAAVLAVVLFVRPLWVFLTYGQDLLKRRGFGKAMERRAARMAARGRRVTIPDKLPWRYVVVISWSGMRGVVTLAAAAGVPALTADGTPFPGRDVIQALAFVVAVGTLLIQGPTLPPLIRWLRVSDPDEPRWEAAQLRRAREVAVDAAIGTIKNMPDGVDPEVMRQFRDRVAASRSVGGDQARLRTPEARRTMLIVRRAGLSAQREALVRARDAGELDDEIVRGELERLDYEEAAAAASD